MADTHTASTGADQAKADLEQGAERARGEANRMMQEAQERGRALFDEQRQSAASQLDGVANALRQTSQQLNAQDQPRLAEYTDWSANCLSRCASNLREREVGEMVNQVQDFARRQPGLFIGGAVVAGLLAARFMRSSGEQASSASSSSQPRTAPTAGEGRQTPFPEDPEADVPGASSAQSASTHNIASGGDSNAVK